MRVQVVSSICALLVGLSASAALGQGGDVLVETSRGLYEAGEAIEVTITNKGGRTIFLAGCGTVVAEGFIGESYRPAPGERCVSEGTAIKLAAGAKHTLQLGAAAKGGAEHFRLQAVYGWGCSDGRALSQARCDDFKTAASAQFRVGRRAD